MTFLDDMTIGLISRVLEAHTGQTITEDRSWRVATVLMPLFREYDISTGSQLVAAMTGPGSEAFVGAMVDALLNNETYFFRDIGVFDTLRQRVLPDLARKVGDRRKLAIWSAGCSTGQEALSLAMIFADQPQQWKGWRIEITATDVSAKAIRTARAGIYSQFEVQRGLAVSQMLRHFDEAPGGWKVRPDLSRMVRFATHNLLDSAPKPGQFDLILCRNVLLYFDAARRTAAFERLSTALKPHGLLLLGGGETAGSHCGYLAARDDAFGLYSLVNRPAAAHALR
ncbi:protein-glutamate O-methyltransferase CheR [Altererythrobacter lauratis]|uniref:CheR family methyltransferase n=1 Tax=Alteraurantiacibacter lauratis TaxID=2054627 RepID=A0ABV7EBL8_9SPHN